MFGADHPCSNAPWRYRDRVDHLRVCGLSVPSELPEQVFPDATPRPAYEPVIDRRRWAISFWAIAPAAAAPEHMHNPADHAPSIRSLDTTYIPRQMRLNPRPLLVRQPEQIPAHQFFPNTNQHRIVQTEKVMSSDPSLVHTPTSVLLEELVAQAFELLIEQGSLSCTREGDP